MARHSPKLPRSTVVAATVFEPDACFWEHVEKEFGPLSHNQRGQITDILESYYASKQFEENAEPVQNARTRMADVQAAANQFWQVLMYGPNHEATRHVERLINDGLGVRPQFEIRYSDAPQVQLDLNVSRYIHLMTAFVEACDLASRNLAAPTTGTPYKPREAWRLMVRSLADFWVASGRKIRVRKDTDVAKTDAPSAFVRFVETIQNALPERFRRHTHSVAALADAIDAALPPRRASPKSGAKVSRNVGE